LGQLSNARARSSTKAGAGKAAQYKSRVLQGQRWRPAVSGRPCPA